MAAIMKEKTGHALSKQVARDDTCLFVCADVRRTQIFNTQYTLEEYVKV